jgi:hypothetical protein
MTDHLTSLMTPVLPLLEFTDARDLDRVLLHPSAGSLSETTTIHIETSVAPREHRQDETNMAENVLFPLFHEAVDPPAPFHLHGQEVVDLAILSAKDHQQGEVVMATILNRYLSNQAWLALSLADKERI